MRPDARSGAAPNARTRGVEPSDTEIVRPGWPRSRGALRRLLDNKWSQRVVVWGGIIVVWELVAQQVGPFFLPTIRSIAEGAVTVAADGGLTLLAGSYRQMFVGYGLAALVGIVLGLAIGSSKIVEWMTDAFVKALFVTSLAAILPFIILLFGTRIQFRIAVVFLFAVLYIIMNTAAGVRSVDRGLLEMASAYNASFFKRFFSITFFGALPFIVSGLRLGLGQAVQGMIIAELWITVDTGRRLTSLALARELGEFFALAAAVAITGALLMHLLLVVQRRLTPWQTNVREGLGGLA